MKHLIKKLLREGLLIESNNAFKDTTGIPDYEQLKIGNYDNLPTKYKDIEARIEYMSPEQYLKLCAKQQDTTYEEQLNFIRKERVEELKKLIKDGTKLYMPYLNNVKGDISQEGRHRAKAAMDLNIEKIPVLIIDYIQNSDYNNNLSNMIKIWNDLSEDEYGNYYVSYDLSGDDWKMKDLLLNAIKKSWDDYYLDYLLSTIVYPTLYPNLLSIVMNTNKFVDTVTISDVINFSDIFPDKYADLFNAYYNAETNEEQKQVEEELSKLIRPLEKFLFLYVLTHNNKNFTNIISYNPNTKIAKLIIDDDIILYDNYESGKDMLSKIKLYDDLDFITMESIRYENIDSKFIEKYIDLVK